ncbi:hypothetical protein [Marinimicrobium alkaliphilum]|uniref:hypothetical protein n=1 Tax=Marinimicrobium alkaliphilum TaxID=2202654 RepID=UPI000DB9E647|nr:hypothetical protein [Marinimicrobium alkaliphilum]
MSDLIPQRYEEWRHCITHTCGIPLTERYIRERIKALNDSRDHMTAGFVQLYGEGHRRQTLAWFERALEELN